MMKKAIHVDEEQNHTKFTTTYAETRGLFEKVDVWIKNVQNIELYDKSKGFSNYFSSSHECIKSFTQAVLFKFQWILLKYFGIGGF